MSFQPRPTIARFLRTDQATAWLNQARTLPLTPTSLLQDIQTLRQTLSTEEAAAIVEQTLLRRRAGQKFERADHMLFVREALEQATRREVAQHRAKRFQGLSRVADLGCGIGGDTLALAQVAQAVWAFDIDEIRLIFAQHNMDVYNTSAQVQFIQADVLRLPMTGGNFAYVESVEAVFADPARRTIQGQRVFSAEQYQPSLTKLCLAYAGLSLAIKVGPSLDFTAVQADEVEVVSYAGEAKEAVLWWGGLAHPAVKQRATLLPSGETLTNLDSSDCPVAPLGDYIYEPDPAIIRAGLVAQAGARLGLTRLDPHLAYLSDNQAVQSPLVTGYHIQAILPLQIKKINRYLKQHGLGRANVKQRGTGLSPERIKAQLKTVTDGPEFFLILTRLQDRHLALICFTLKIG